MKVTKVTWVSETRTEIFLVNIQASVTNILTMIVFYAYHDHTRRASGIYDKELQRREGYILRHR